MNHHFSLMSGGIKATEPRRTAEAAGNVEVMNEQILAHDPEAHVAVLGDLNSLYASPALDTLREAGLERVLATVADDERYNLQCCPKKLRPTDSTACRYLSTQDTISTHPTLLSATSFSIIVATDNCCKIEVNSVTL
ncbi:MAG: hypothetical protein GY759_11735 [Chloroflexi bacterium]|nr:hypothetical protein [Chloroflexota bacterium]